MRRTNDDHKWTERAQHEHQHHQPTHPMDPNPWLVDELYDLFRDDPSAVGPSWHEFFADYQPSDAEAAEPVGTDRTAPAPETVSASAPEAGTGQTS